MSSQSTPRRSKRVNLPRDAKVCAYNDAIGFLQAQESDSDTPADVEARHWLADKLDRECDRWIARLKVRK